MEEREPSARCGSCECELAEAGTVSALWVASGAPTAACWSIQVVISGTQQGVDIACSSLQDAGIVRRAVRLKVSAPFHCSLLQPAADELQGALESVHFTQPVFPVVSNVTARPVGIAGSSGVGGAETDREWSCALRADLVEQVRRVCMLLAHRASCASPFLRDPNIVLAVPRSPTACFGLTAWFGLYMRQRAQCCMSLALVGFSRAWLLSVCPAMLPRPRA